MLTDALIGEILATFEQQQDTISGTMPGHLTLYGIDVNLQALGALAASLAAGKNIGLDAVERAVRLSGERQDGAFKTHRHEGWYYLSWWDAVVSKAQAAIDAKAKDDGKWSLDATSAAIICALVRIADLWLWLEKRKFWWQRHPYRKSDLFTRLLTTNSLAVSAIEHLLEDLGEQEEALHCASASVERYWMEASGPRSAVFDLISKDGGSIWPHYQSARAKVKSTDMSWLRSMQQARLLVFLQDRSQVDIVRQRLVAEVGQGCDVVWSFASDMVQSEQSLIRRGSAPF